MVRLAAVVAAAIVLAIPRVQAAPEPAADEQELQQPQQPQQPEHDNPERQESPTRHDSLELSDSLTPPLASKADLTGIIKDEGWARVLGKALFWDTLASRHSACAACHFNAAADRNIPDQMATGASVVRTAASAWRDVVSALDGDTPPPPGEAASTSSALARPDWDGLANPGDAVEICSDQILTRSPELSDRPAPRKIAHRRARGADDEATDDRAAQHMTRESSTADPESVGDLSCRRERTASFVRTLLSTRPLDGRMLHPQDSLFGADGPHGNLISPTGRGLDRTYTWLIQQAFDDTLWKVADPQAPAETQESSSSARIENNFAFFWAVAVRLYAATLPASADGFHACSPGVSFGSPGPGCQESWTAPRDAGLSKESF
jgi:hypothetical protein